jgi:putative transposase
MDRTIVLNVCPTPEQASILHRTLLEHTACFNAVVHEGFTQQMRNGVELHKQTYYPLRAAYPDLPAQLVCAARVKATESVKSALTWRAKNIANYPKRVAKAQKKGKPVPVFKPVKCPYVKYCPIRYDARSYWLKWESLTCSLATVAGRVELSFTVPTHAQKYIGGKVCSADLIYHKGKWRLHITVSIAEPAVPSTQEVVGVDLGLNHPAVTSNRHFLGERRWKEQERRIFRIRRKLQAKGTRSAKRHLKKLSGKLFRQRRDHDHVLSKRIVQNTTPGSTIVLENLTHIRDTSKIGKSKKNDTKRRLHSWSFAQFHTFLSYKAQEQGIQVVKIDPRHTSQTCSQCGYQHRSNRRSQSLFLCRQCGFSLNADLNASRNIREKHLATLGTSLSSGPPSSELSYPLLVGEMQAPSF